MNFRWVLISCRVIEQHNLPPYFRDVYLSSCLGRQPSQLRIDSKHRVVEVLKTKERKTIVSGDKVEDWESESSFQCTCDKTLKRDNHCKSHLACRHQSHASTHIRRAHKQQLCIPHECSPQVVFAKNSLNCLDNKLEVGTESNHLWAQTAMNTPAKQNIGNAATKNGIFPFFGHFLPRTLWLLKQSALACRYVAICHELHLTSVFG